jgi:hypothetical protein
MLSRKEHWACARCPFPGTTRKPRLNRFRQSPAPALVPKNPEIPADSKHFVELRKRRNYGWRGVYKLGPDSWEGLMSSKVVSR